MDAAGHRTGHIIGGHKATLSNPNTSAEAKQHSRSVLEEMGELAPEDTRDATTAGDTTTTTAESKMAESKMAESKMAESKAAEGKDLGHVVGGYKAALKNPNVSEEAKEHAEEALEELGAK